MLGSIGGGLGLLGGPLLGAADPPFLASGPVTSRRPRSGSRGGGVQVTAMAAPPPRNEFYAEVTPLNSTSRCAGCNGMLGENSTRIGVRPLGAPASRYVPSYRWHHITCLPAVLWLEAHLEGVHNLRAIPARDQAMVRERLSSVGGGSVRRR